MNKDKNISHIKNPIEKIVEIGKSITLTHKYMTAHSPDLVQAKSITLTHKYMTAHSPGLVQAFQ
jgi:hypothetical protein